MSLLFFGYGAYRSKSKMTQVIGYEPEGLGAILEDHILAIQTLSQISQPAQDLLKSAWGEDFKAYTLKKGKGLVHGIVWNIKEEDFVKIKEWEFIGTWREIVEVEVRTAEDIRLKVFTEKVFEVSPISKAVDGLLYNEFILTDQHEKQKAESIEYYTQEQLKKIREDLKHITR